MKQFEVFVAYEMLKKLNSDAYTIGELKKIVRSEAWMHIEGGHAAGTAVGGKLSLTFDDSMELEAFKSFWINLLDQRGALCRATLVALGVELDGGAIDDQSK